VPTTTQQGLGWAHQKRRKALLAQHIEGALCDECGKPMYSWQNLDADHTVERALGGTVADRLLHASPCNRGRWGRRKRKTRIKPTTSREW
jgi:hypothetical protein